MTWFICSVVTGHCEENGLDRYRIAVGITIKRIVQSRIVPVLQQCAGDRGGPGHGHVGQSGSTFDVCGVCVGKTGF